MNNGVLSRIITWAISDFKLVTCVWDPSGPSRHALHWMGHCLIKTCLSGNPNHFMEGTFEDRRWIFHSHNCGYGLHIMCHKFENMIIRITCYFINIPYFFPSLLKLSHGPIAAVPTAIGKLIIKETCISLRIRKLINFLSIFCKLSKTMWATWAINRVI